MKIGIRLRWCIGLIALVVVALLLWRSREKPLPTIVIIGEDSANLVAMESLKESFEGKHHISVKFIRDPFDVALQKSNQDLANGTGQYDIICQYAASLAPYVNNNYVLTLDDMEKLVPPSEVSRDFERDFFPNVWRETGYFRRSGEVPRILVPGVMRVGVG